MAPFCQLSWRSCAACHSHTTFVYIPAFTDGGDIFLLASPLLRLCLRKGIKKAKMGQQQTDTQRTWSNQILHLQQSRIFCLCLHIFVLRENLYLYNVQLTMPVMTSYINFHQYLRGSFSSGPTPMPPTQIHVKCINAFQR